MTYRRRVPIKAAAPPRRRTAATTISATSSPPVEGRVHGKVVVVVPVSVEVVGAVVVEAGADCSTEVVVTSGATVVVVVTSGVVVVVTSGVVVVVTSGVVVVGATVVVVWHGFGLGQFSGHPPSAPAVAPGSTTIATAVAMILIVDFMLVSPFVCGSSQVLPCVRSRSGGRCASSRSV